VYCSDVTNHDLAPRLIQPNSHNHMTMKHTDTTCTTPTQTHEQQRNQLGHNGNNIMKRTCTHVNTCIRRMKKDDSSTHPRRLHFIHRWYGILICCYVHEMILPSCSLILSCILFLLSGMMIMLDRRDDEASILSWMFGIGFMFVWYYLIKHDSTRSGHIGFNSCLSSYVGQW